MKRYYITAIVTSLVVLLAFGFLYKSNTGEAFKGVIKVGFVYETDESTPYTYNFALAASELERQYPGRVKIYVKSNVLEDETAEPLRDLARLGCSVIFVNNYSTQVMALAPQYPNVQFCQASFSDLYGKEYPANYHTFNGEIYEGRYVSGIAAGMKLRSLIDEGVITADQALVGYVGAFATREVISGYTAFLLGVRSVAPEAVMKVRYTGMWSSYSHEKACAQRLIADGCVVIAQHTDTIGPAVACEEAAGDRPLIHVGYNQSMIDVAPTTSLTSTRVNWTPYITGAVGALLNGRPIEKYVAAETHGNDMSAGFDYGWVEVLELNKHVAAEGTQEAIDKEVDAFRRGGVTVFQGNYTGVNPRDPGDTCDLSKGYQENDKFSAPTFGYILEDVVEVLRN